MSEYQVDCIELKTNEHQEHYGQFIFHPLEYGQGLILGNSLRRILLTELEGNAITSLRIVGASHEFSSLNGVREDILEIILNLKEIVLKGKLTEPIWGRLKVQGPKMINAGLINLPDVEIVNPEHYIATISENATLEFEIKIENGKGYKLIQQDFSDDPIDFLQIDAIFMPVKKVSYRVEKVQYSGNMEKERLILDIITNGSITPPEALHFASQNFQNLLKPLKIDTFQNEKSNNFKEEKKVTEIAIEELGLSVRSYNALKKVQINRLSDLAKYSLKDLKKIRNLGQKSIREITDILQKRVKIS